MDSAMRLAEMMSRGKLVPAHLQASPGDCLMVIEAAMRWGMSPFAVAQCTSVIQGKLMFEGKLVAAALNASGIMSSRLAYRHTGEGASRAVEVSGILRGETEQRKVVVTLQEAKTNNGMWTKQPDQQLVYAGTRVWARRHAPEVMLGVYAPEEFEHADMPAREPPHNGPTLEHEAEPPKPEPKPETRREAINRETPLHPTPPPTGDATPPKPPNMPGFRDFLKSLEIAVRDCTDIHQVNRIIARPDTQFALATYKDVAARELKAIIADGIAAHAPVQSVEPPDDDGDLWPGDEPVTEPAAAEIR
jgi:hypothetical protein